MENAFQYNIPDETFRLKGTARVMCERELSLFAWKLAAAFTEVAILSTKDILAFIRVE